MSIITKNRLSRRRRYITSILPYNKVTTTKLSYRRRFRLCNKLDYI